MMFQAIVTEIVYATAQYTDEDLSWVAGQSWEGPKDIKSGLRPYIPIHDREEFERTVDLIVARWHKPCENVI